MSLRTRMTLSLVALMLALGLAAALGLQNLSRDLRDALDDTATRVGRSMVTVFRSTQELRVGAKNAADPATAAPDLQTQLKVIVDGRELSAEQIAALPAEHHRHLLRASEAGELRFEVRHADAGRPHRLRVSGENFEREIPLPQSALDAALERFLAQLGWGLVGLLVIAVLAAAWLAARISRPLQGLAAAARALGGGQLGTVVAESGPSEVRESIRAFNRMSADLQRLAAEAAALRGDRELAELGEIGRGLAHSLRNPLHALGLSLEALAAETPNAPRAVELACAGREQLSRIDQALRGFLALSAGAGASAEAVVLRELVDDVLLEASQRAQGRVCFERDCAANLQLRGVAAELRILLHTLVMNALDASPDGGVVRLSARGLQSGGIQLEVLDQGVGIAPAIRERLFQPHVSSKPTGAGMGLFLAERLVRLRYHGRLQLLDAPPQGTRAVLELQERSVSHAH